MENVYYNELLNFKNKINEYISTIFRVYGNELELRLEEYNLLQNPQNHIESSTTFGYILEEFLISKLETYTSSNSNDNEYKIGRGEGKANVYSYDCVSSLNNGIMALINLKVEKEGRSNNAVASINQLYSDYVLNNKNLAKCYLVFKTRYTFDVSNKDNKRRIKILSFDSYYLEEIDFSKEHKQDHRNWSRDFNINSGRLQVTNKFMQKNKKDISKISYENTKREIELIYSSNKEI